MAHSANPLPSLAARALLPLLLSPAPALAVCQCTPQQRTLIYWGVAGLFALVGLVILWVARRHRREATLAAPAPAEPADARYRVTANFQVYDLHTKEIVYRARSRAEALGWLERTLQAPQAE